jgi:DNA primase
MDITLLVKLLAPCLPFLTGLGQKALEKGAEKLGEQGASGLLPLMNRIWEKLHPKVLARSAALEAAEEVAKNVDDEEALATLRRQLREILEAPENAELAAEVAALLTNAEAKFAVHVKDSQVGVIGDHAMVTMNIGTKPYG